MTNDYRTVHEWVNNTTVIPSTIPTLMPPTTSTFSSWERLKSPPAMRNFYRYRHIPPDHKTDPFLSRSTFDPFSRKNLLNQSQFLQVFLSQKPDEARAKCRTRTCITDWFWRRDREHCPHATRGMVAKNGARREYLTCRVWREPPWHHRLYHCLYN